MTDLRIWFEKHDDAKYISHLDLNRYMPRALRRADIPVWFTEGYNKHIYVNFALPLSMGYESRNDCFEIRIDESLISSDEVYNRLSVCMPRGIVITKITLPKMKYRDIAYANYTLVLSAKEDETEEILGFLSKSEIPVIKKSKSSEKKVNLAEEMKNLSVYSENGSVNVNVDMPAGCTSNVNPSLIVQALQEIKENIRCLKTVRNGFKNQCFDDFC